MKFILSIIALGVAGFAAGYFNFAREDSLTERAIAAKAAPDRVSADLRRGDPAHVMEMLRKLAAEDPRAFFKELRHLPCLDGMNEIVAAAAARLAENNPADAADLLNGIPNNMRLRERAWLAFVTSLRDRSPLEKIRIAKLAGYLGDSIVDQAVVMPAVTENPDETLRILRDGGEISAYCLLLGELGGSRPGEVISIIKADLASGRLKPAECQITLENLARNHPDPEVLSAISGWIKDYGWKEGIYAGPIFAGAFNSGEQAQVLDSIATLPAVQKNFVLSRIHLADCPDSALAAQVLNSMDSTELQITALKVWQSSGADAAKLAEVSALIRSERTREQWRAATAGGGR